MKTCHLCVKWNNTPVTIEARISAIWIWFSPLWAIKTCVIVIYCNVLYVLTKWSKSKVEVIQEQKAIQDFPSSMCFHANGWGPRFNTHWGNILLLDFLFSFVKPLMQKLPLLSILCVCEKLDWLANKEGSISLWIAPVEAWRFWCAVDTCSDINISYLLPIILMYEH